MNALTKYIGGHGNALAGSITDTGLFDWTRFPNIAENYKSQPPKNWGLQQLRKKGLRDFGGTLAAEQAHHISVGAETLALRMERICANALALAQWLEGSRKCAPCTTPACRRIPSTRSPVNCSTVSAVSCRSNLPTAWIRSRSSTA